MKKQEIQSPMPVCKTCGHSHMSHLASCFAKGCKCKQYIPNR